MIDDEHELKKDSNLLHGLHGIFDLEDASLWRPPEERWSVSNLRTFNVFDICDLPNGDHSGAVPPSFLMMFKHASIVEISRTLQNKTVVSAIGVDTSENGPSQV